MNTFGREGNRLANRMFRMVIERNKGLKGAGVVLIYCLACMLAATFDNQNPFESMTFSLPAIVFTFPAGLGLPIAARLGSPGAPIQMEFGLAAALGWLLYIGVSAAILLANRGSRVIALFVVLAAMLGFNALILVALQGFGASG